MGQFSGQYAPSNGPRCPSLLTRILAVIGTILLLERTLSYSVYRNYNGSFHPQNPTASQQDTSSLSEQVGNLVSHPREGGDGKTFTGPSKALIVASSTKDNTSWIREHFSSDWDLNIYVADDKKADLTVLKKEGREAAVYLTYIINHYYNLPDIMVFMHAGRYQWHNDDPMYDGVPPVKNLQLQRVKDRGYQSLRCSWYPGCPVGAEPSTTAKENIFGTRKAYAHAFTAFFPDEPLPSEVGAPCCGQFAVSREQVHKRPIQEYERFRLWLWTVKIGGGKTGRVFEYMWHYIFNKPINDCPNAAECYCKTFGLCYLKCKEEKKCLGRWIMPPWNSEMHENWPEQGPGERGWPADKWWEQHYPPSEWNGFEPKDPSGMTPNAR